MKYWNDKDVLERDILEGESIFDANNPHPAYKGMKILSSGVDYLFEVEIIPGTERMEAIIDPSTFNSVVGNVCDIIHRRWNDSTNQWDEMKLPSLLSAWGYKTIPPHKQTQAYLNFDYAMKGI